MSFLVAYHPSTFAFSTTAKTLSSVTETFHFDSKRIAARLLPTSSIQVHPIYTRLGILLQFLQLVLLFFGLEAGRSVLYCLAIHFTRLELVM